MNRWFQPVVMLTGVMATSRTIAVVECEMPQEVESFEQGVAWVIYCLDNQTDDDIFKPASSVPGLPDGYSVVFVRLVGLLLFTRCFLYRRVLLLTVDGLFVCAGPVPAPMPSFAR